MRETSCQRAKKDTIAAFGTIRFWVFDTLFAAVVTAWVLIFPPSFVQGWVIIVYQIALPILAAIVGLLIVLLVSLAMAPYKQRDAARNELQQIYEQKTAKRYAEMTAYKPMAELGSFKDTKEGINIEGVCASFVPFRNISQTITAKNVWANISYRSLKGDILLELDGLWNEVCDPSIVTNFSGDVREVDFKPNGASYNLIVAFKYLNDDCCYGYNYGNSSVKDYRRPDHKLAGNKFMITISLYGQNLHGLETFMYILTNYGKDTGLSMEPYEEEDVQTKHN